MKDAFKFLSVGFACWKNKMEQLYIQDTWPIFKSLQNTT